MGTLRAKEIFNHAGLRLVVIESAELRCSKEDLGCQVYGRLDPIAVIICARDHVYALDMKAQPIAIDQLLEDIPELQDIIAPFNIL